VIAAAPGLDAPVVLRVRLADLYAAYDEALADGVSERWPELFSEDCLYRIIPRENYEAGLPASLMYAESRAMLADRVLALRETTVYAPRTLRRLTGQPCLCAVGEDGLRLTMDFAVFQTMLNEPSRVFLVGRCYDRVVEERDALRFAERICVADSTLVPTSLVFPI
jgi:3-phenylpropionate/cinnamic acid dioxygenase small subunit